MRKHYRRIYKLCDERGYLGNAAATAPTIASDGWMKTGYLCYFDEDGFVYIVDRIKELIKHNGYQVP